MTIFAFPEMRMNRSRNVRAMNINAVVVDFYRKFVHDKFSDKVGSFPESSVVTICDLIRTQIEHDRTQNKNTLLRHHVQNLRLRLDAPYTTTTQPAYRFKGV